MNRAGRTCSSSTPTSAPRPSCSTTSSSTGRFSTRTEDSGQYRAGCRRTSGSRSRRMRAHVRRRWRAPRFAKQSRDRRRLGRDDGLRAAGPAEPSGDGRRTSRAPPRARMVCCRGGTNAGLDASSHPLSRGRPAFVSAPSQMSPIRLRDGSGLVTRLAAGHSNAIPQRPHEGGTRRTASGPARAGAGSPHVRPMPRARCR